MTRNGKIARLPYKIRLQLNLRLEDGASGVEVVAWLNKQWQVKDVMKELFAGRPINEQNLTEWKQGGFLEWQKRQEGMELARDLADNADEMAEVANGPISDKLASLLIAKYMTMIKTLNTDSGEAPGDWKLLRELCSDLVALRKGDHSAERLKLEQRRY